jgi:hypothetical protein
MASRLGPAVVLTALVAAPVSALPPPGDTPAALLEEGEPVISIPAADAIRDFHALDNEHVMLELEAGQHYLLTLNRQCVGLRWARHVGVTASQNTIWAGFDVLTADGEACPIHTIHRLDASTDTL